MTEEENDKASIEEARRLSKLYRAVRIRMTEQANDNSRSRASAAWPFKGFRMEAVDRWPENVFDLCTED
jgi:hypothetical protein